MTSFATITDCIAGHLHRPRRRVHREGRQDHLPDGQDCLPPVNASVRYDASAPMSRIYITQRILIRRRNGAGADDEQEKPKENIIKFGQPRVQVSGPLAAMVQERLRRRNEL
jgi:hypothetical protein